MKFLRSKPGKLTIIHALAALGLFALWGFVMTSQALILLGVYLSVGGALCTSFIVVLDAIRAK